MCNLTGACLLFWRSAGPVSFARPDGAAVFTVPEDHVETQILLAALTPRPAQRYRRTLARGIKVCAERKLRARKTPVARSGATRWQRGASTGGNQLFTVERSLEEVSADERKRQRDFRSNMAVSGYSVNPWRSVLLFVAHLGILC